MLRLIFRSVLPAVILSALIAGRTLADPAVESETHAGSAVEIPSLFDSPAPFFHDYNLSVLFPVSKGIPEAVFGQVAADGKVLTLRECIERALEDSPNHRKTKENLRAYTGELLAAWGNFIPTVNSRYGLSQTNRNSSFVDPSGTLRTTGGISKSTFGNLSFNLPIFNSGRHYFELRNARYFKKEREFRIESSELDLVSQVSQAYLNVLRDQKLLLAAQRQADQRREQLRLAEARFSVGSVTRLDVLQAQIEVKNAELLIVQDENALATARMDLNRVMGGKLGEEFELADDFEVDLQEHNVESLVNEAVENHPDIKILGMQIHQLGNNLKMGRLAYLPTIGTSLNYSRNEDEVVLLPRQVQGRGLSLSVNWDIFDAFNRFQNNRTIEINLHNLNYDLATNRLNIEREVRAGLLELDRLYQRHVTLRESEQLAAQSLELEQERYRLGASSLLELRQAQVDYSQAEVNYINSIYDYHIELSRLSRNVGRDLTGRYTN